MSATALRLPLNGYRAIVCEYGFRGATLVMGIEVYATRDQAQTAANQLKELMNNTTKGTL